MNYYIGVLKKYATFSGRARRAEYWYFTLFNIIISIVLAFIDAAIGMGGTGAGAGGGNIGVLGLIYGLAVLIPGLAVLVRRLHDTGKSAWWLLLLLIPLVGAIVILVFMILEGEQGENKYGPNPISAA